MKEKKGPIDSVECRYIGINRIGFSIDVNSLPNPKKLIRKFKYSKLGNRQKTTSHTRQISEQLQNVYWEIRGHKKEDT